MTERDVMEFDVVIVGGGPSGMATAIHLKNLIERHNAEVEKTGQGEPIPGEVVLIEKAAEIGAHSISGAVMDPKGLDALIPQELSTWMVTAAESRRAWRRDGVPMEQRRPLLLKALNRLYAKREGAEAARELVGVGVPAGNPRGTR